MRIGIYIIWIGCLYILLVEFNHFAVVLISGLDSSRLVGTFVIEGQDYSMSVYI